MSGLDKLLRTFVGVGAVPAALLIAVLVVGGFTAGTVFPKFQAEALLELPEAKLAPNGKPDPASLGNVIELQLYKRVEASYGAIEPLRVWLDASGTAGSAAGQRLMKQAESAKFWSTVAVPVLPFSKEDQKLYGDIKDASSTQLIGVQIKTDARTEPQAAEMTNVMARYFTSALLRERVRGWVATGRQEAEGTAQTLRADIVRSELEIGLLERRAADMKAIIARHPDAARMDARQVVSVNAAEGGERYLSPLAQLFGAESSISQQREEIGRLERKIAQRELLAAFYAEAATLVDATPDVAVLLPALKQAATRSFASADAAQDWVKEARLRVDGALDNFAAMQAQFGVRNGVRVEGVASRDPLRLALFGLLAGLGLLGGTAFVRASLKSMREERERGDAEDEPAPRR